MMTLGIQLNCSPSYSFDNYSLFLLVTDLVLNLDLGSWPASFGDPPARLVPGSVKDHYPTYSSLAVR